MVAPGKDALAPPLLPEGSAPRFVVRERAKTSRPRGVLSWGASLERTPGREHYRQLRMPVPGPQLVVGKHEVHTVAATS